MLVPVPSAVAVRTASSGGCCRGSVVQLVLVCRLGKRLTSSWAAADVGSVVAQSVEVCYPCRVAPWSDVHVDGRSMLRVLRDVEACVVS